MYFVTEKLDQLSHLPVNWTVRPIYNFFASRIPTNYFQIEKEPLKWIFEKAEEYGNWQVSPEQNFFKKPIEYFQLQAVNLARQVFYYLDRSSRADDIRKTITTRVTKICKACAADDDDYKTSAGLLKTHTNDVLKNALGSYSHSPTWVGLVGVGTDMVARRLGSWTWRWIVVSTVTSYLPIPIVNNLEFPAYHIITGAATFVFLSALLSNASQKELNNLKAFPLEMKDIYTKSLRDTINTKFQTLFSNVSKPRQNNFKEGIDKLDLGEMPIYNYFTSSSSITSPNKNALPLTIKLVDAPITAAWVKQQIATLKQIKEDSDEKDTALQIYEVLEAGLKQRTSPQDSLKDLYGQFQTLEKAGKTDQRIIEFGKNLIARLLANALTMKPPAAKPEDRKREKLVTNKKSSAKTTPREEANEEEKSPRKSVKRNLSKKEFADDDLGVSPGPVKKDDKGQGSDDEST